MSIVPTSAHTGTCVQSSWPTATCVICCGVVLTLAGTIPVRAAGEGVPDLLFLLVSLTQKLLSKRLEFHPDVFVATVLEVKVIEGLGTTIDVILVDGILREVRGRARVFDLVSGGLY